MAPGWRAKLDVQDGKGDGWAVRPGALGRSDACVNFAEGRGFHAYPAMFWVVRDADV